MNLKVTLLLISAILLMMLGAGGASAYIGYLMGREALKVVTQPDTNSEKSIDRKKPVGGSHKGLTIIDERTILIKVYNQIHHKKKSSSNQEQSSSTKKISAKVKDSNYTIKPSYFPLKNQSQGVTMEISQARREGNSLMLDVNLKNESSQPVRFLYSFLDVRDEQNHPLSAIAEGLPGEIPANGENFAGKLIIPLVLLDQAQKISLTLEDYPEQRLKLELNSIPVTN